VGKQCDQMSFIPGMDRLSSPLHLRLDLGSSLSLKMVPGCFAEGRMACVCSLFLPLITQIQIAWSYLSFCHGA
jgi:hypothetical protein